MPNNHLGLEPGPVEATSPAMHLEYCSLTSRLLWPTVVIAVCHICDIKVSSNFVFFHHHTLVNVNIRNYGSSGLVLGQLQGFIGIAENWQQMSLSVFVAFNF